MPDPVVPGPPASVLAAVSGSDGAALPPSNPAFTGRATFAAQPDTLPVPASLMTEIVAMPSSAYLDADVEIAGNLTVDGSFSGILPGQYLISPAVILSGTFTSASATLSAVAAGTVSTGLFAAPPSGEVIVEVDVVVNSSAASAVGFGLAATGTVTPVVGHVIGIEQSSLTPYSAAHLVFPVTGLTAGSSYNFDVLFGIANGNTVTAAAVNSTATTVTTASKGGPIVIAVKAV